MFKGEIMKKIIILMAMVILLMAGQARAEESKSQFINISLQSGVTTCAPERQYLVIHVPDPKGYWDKSSHYNRGAIESLICHSSNGKTLSYHWFSSEYQVVQYLNEYQIENSWQTKIYKIEKVRLKQKEVWEESK